MIKVATRNGSGFSSQNYMKVTLLSTQNETMLNHTTHASSLLAFFSYDIFTCRPSYIPKSALCEILRLKLTAKGV